LGGSARGGWLTSVPGAHEISVDALAGSPLPARLVALGYIVEKTGTSERITGSRARRAVSDRAVTRQHAPTAVREPFWFPGPFPFVGGYWPVSTLSGQSAGRYPLPMGSNLKKWQWPVLLDAKKPPKS
jgi:hypothetical protein